MGSSDSKIPRKNTNTKEQGFSAKDHSGNGVIHDVIFEDALKERYLSYALSTIIARSLPDVRDGLKPVHRRLLYAMRELHLPSSAKPKKSARIVGDVMGKFHPHGDSSIYAALVRMAQDFSMRYPLIEGQGNFGNIDGDDAAAMRYTEARLTPICDLLLEGLDENASDFMDTYDGTSCEPGVLSGCFPNLLANGTTGIAVGMATSIPPHNVHELCLALIHLLEHPKSSASELMEFVKGPDFPTGGIITDTQDTLLQIYETGRGSIKLRSTYVIDEALSTKTTVCVVITGVPYMIQKGKLIEKLASLIIDKKIPEIVDLQDASDEEIRLQLYIKSNAPERVMEKLFNFSDLQTSFHFNMNVLDKNRIPHVMGLREILLAFLDHQKEVLIRRTTFQCDKAKVRLEVLSGYLIVYDHLDRVIEIIRTKDDPAQELSKTFSLTTAQVDAILGMRLKALRALYEKDIKKEHQELTKTLETLTKLLNSTSLQKKHIEKQLRRIIDLYGKETTVGKRRTQMIPMTPITYDPEDDIPDEDVVIFISNQNWIGTSRTNDAKYKEGDEARFVLPGRTKDVLILASLSGRFYTLFPHKLPKQRQSEALRLIIDIDPKDQIVAAFLVKQDSSTPFLLIGTDAKGFQTTLSHLLSATRVGRHVFNGSLKYVFCMDGDMRVGVLGVNRKLILLPLIDIPTMQKGGGVTLLKAPLLYAFTLKKEEPLTWARAGKTYNVSDLRPWLLKRGSAGRLAPIGFLRDAL